jgi:hypothetical protein
LNGHWITNKPIKSPYDCTTVINMKILGCMLSTLRWRVITDWSTRIHVRGLSQKLSSIFTCYKRDYWNLCCKLKKKTYSKIFAFADLNSKNNFI